MSRIFTFIFAVTTLFPNAMLFGQDSIGNASLRLLADKEVQHEIELVDYQIELVHEVQQQYQRTLDSSAIRTMNVLKTAIPGERAERIKEIRGDVKRVKQKLEEKIYHELIPLQSTRLRQLESQRYLYDHQFVMHGKISTELVKELHITEIQLREIEEKSIEVRQRYLTEIARLRREADEEVLTVLSEEQLARYMSIVGGPNNQPPANNPAAQELQTDK